ncbi:MAG: DUF3018 family protein [Neisseriaceae bacterium]|nr:DUF3018 family protein [Neisseriaceae bacterium]
MLAIRLPAEMENSLTQLASETGKTKAFHIREAITEYLKNLKNKKRFETWVLDTDNPEVQEQLKKECALISKCPDNKEWLDIAEQSLNEFADEWKYE